MSKDFRDTRLPKKENEVERPQYPNLNLPLELLPGAERWPMDRDYEITLRVRVESVNVREVRRGRDSKGSINLDITGIRADKIEESQEKEEKSEGSYKERE